MSTRAEACAALLDDMHTSDVAAWCARHHYVLCTREFIESLAGRIDMTVTFDDVGRFPLRAKAEGGGMSSNWREELDILCDPPFDPRVEKERAAAWVADFNAGTPVLNYLGWGSRKRDAVVEVGPSAFTRPEHGGSGDFVMDVRGRGGSICAALTDALGVYLPYRSKL